MKVFLMHRAVDFDLEGPLPVNEEALTQDLELNTLFQAAARGDTLLFDIVRRAVLTSLTDPEAITYRQYVLGDCLANAATVRALYGLTVQALEEERKIWQAFMNTPDAILHRGVEVLELFVEYLRKLRQVAEEERGAFRSEGWQRLFTTLMEELDDAYFQTIGMHLRALKFRRGVVISAGLGPGNKGVDYVLRRPSPQQRWWERLFSSDHSEYTFQIADRDESGFRALGELRGKGINLVANALARSADHILSFFRVLRTELGFYVGCLNLYEMLTRKGEPICFPVPVVAGTLCLSARGLFDPCLTLSMEGRVIGNDVTADGKSLLMVTGANQGGKSTFLRSVGLAHLMMQSGMFVGAEAFSANVSKSVFTHFMREEDTTMESGKLDEELSRMNEVAEHVEPGCLLLCNESFASTNEREGSEIARQVVRAMTEAGIKVAFVTHLFDLAHGLFAQRLDTTLFLRAERLPNGERTFRVVEGEPLPTSHGQDSYTRVFGKASSEALVSAG